MKKLILLAVVGMLAVGCGFEQPLPPEKECKGCCGCGPRKEVHSVRVQKNVFHPQMVGNTSVELCWIFDRDEKRSTGFQPKDRCWSADVRTLYEVAGFGLSQPEACTTAAGLVIRANADYNTGVYYSCPPAQYKLDWLDVRVNGKLVSPRKIRIHDFCAGHLSQYLLTPQMFGCPYRKYGEVICRKEPGKEPAINQRFTWD